MCIHPGIRDSLLFLTISAYENRITDYVLAHEGRWSFSKNTGLSVCSREGRTGARRMINDTLFV